MTESQLSASGFDSYCIEGLPGGSDGKESTCNVGDLDLIPGLGRSPGEGNHYPLQYSGLENSMDCIVHGVTKSQTRLSIFHFQGLDGYETANVILKPNRRIRKGNVKTALEEGPCLDYTRNNA